MSSAPRVIASMVGAIEPACGSDGVSGVGDVWATVFVGVGVDVAAGVPVGVLVGVGVGV